MADVALLKRRHDAFKTARATQVEAIWRECFDVSMPIRGLGLSGPVVGGAQAGRAKQAQRLDGTAADAANTLAANIMAGLTPANALWFALDVGHETDEERRWLDQSAELLWENIHLGNFDAEAFEGCLDLVHAGQFALFIDEDRERGGLNFEQWPLAGVYCASTRADGRVDIVHRELPLTAEQLVAEYGADVVPEKVRKAKPDDPFTVLLAIYPRPMHVANARLAKNLPVASCHVLLESGTVLRESGFHEMPVIVPRWMKVPGSVYAVGPMYPALPDIGTLNELLAQEIAAAEIAVSGMWLGIDDGVLNPRTVRLGPRKIVIAADKDSLTPLQTGANFDLAETKVAQLQAAIRKALMADQLQPQDGPQMTATEVHVRVEMIRKLLGPIYGRLQAEYLKPLVDRCFGLAYRAGIFAPPPDSLRGRAFAVRYVSPMARAQKLDEVQAIEQTFAAAAQLAPMVPDILDELDPAKALELIAEGRGAPAAIRRTAEDVARIRSERQAAQQRLQQQQAQLAQQQTLTEAAAKRA